MNQQDYESRKKLLNDYIECFLETGLDGWKYIFDLKLHAEALCLAPSQIFLLFERSRNQHEQPQSIQVEEPQFVCEDCGERFITAHKLQSHRGGKKHSKLKN